MLIQGQVGPSSTQSVSPGATPAVRQGQLGDVIVSELHGRYYEQAYRGNLFTLSVSTAAAITAYVGAAGGTPMLAVYNPVSSGKNIVPIQVGYNNVVAASGAGTVSFALWFGPTAVITQATLTNPVNNATLNRTGSVTQCFTNVALTSSTALTNAYPVGFYYWATAAGVIQTDRNLSDINGSIIVPPGTMIALGGSAALTSATWIGSLTWEEVPI
jgi:hypothetical protein